MAIFGKKNNNQPLPAVDGLYPADSTGNALVANTIDNYTGGSGVNYVNSQTEILLKGGVVEEQKETPQVTDATLLMDISQSHHFTVHLEGFSMTGLKIASSPLTNKEGFLPVKTMNLKYTSYENMSIPVAIFGDFPLLNKKRVSTIDLTCYDLDSNKLEYALRKWESDCFPKGRFVAYMDDIAKKFTYKGYGVDGRGTLTYEVYVIPAGNVTVSRDYSANEAKMVSFSLVVVGDGRTCATGDGKVPGEIPIQDHGGGAGEAGSFATTYISGYRTNYDKGLSKIHSERFDL